MNINLMALQFFIQFTTPWPACHRRRERGERDRERACASLLIGIDLDSSQVHWAWQSWFVTKVGLTREDVDLLLSIPIEVYKYQAPVAFDRKKHCGDREREREKRQRVCVYGKPCRLRLLITPASKRSGAGKRIG